MNSTPKLMNHEFSEKRVTVLNQYGEHYDGIARVVFKSGRQAFWRGALKSAKVIGVLFLCLLPFGLLEPFLFMVWGSIALFFLLSVLGPYLHLKFARETASFLSVESRCPHCHLEASMSPYLSTKFESEFTVICNSCGETCRVKS